MMYGGIFRRLFAFMIDCTVLIAFYVIIGMVFGISVFFNPILALPMMGLWWYGGILSFSWLYFSLFESSAMQATIGKKVLGLKVVDAHGNQIGFFRASVRYLSKILSRITLFIGFLMIAITKKRQALHDKVANTYVVLDQ